jgi:hyperosmotically inducible protein
MNMNLMLFPSLLLCTVGLARAADSPTAADRALDRVLNRADIVEPAKKDVVERPDAWITAKVKSSLLLHKSVSALGTAVETDKGIVSLRGEAVNQAQKDLAEEYALEVEGVKAVSNMMTVKGERTLDARLDDAAITALVKTALLSRRSTSAINTTVTTISGVVTLGGLARNEEEKELAEKLAKGVRGVKQVVNRMNVE